MLEFRLLPLTKQALHLLNQEQVATARAAQYSRTIDIFYSASLSAWLGLECETIPLPDEIETTGDLLPWLMTRRGEWLKALSGDLVIRVNKIPADGTKRIRDGDAVMFLRTEDMNTQEKR